MKSSPAVAIALSHINAWSRHDWEQTRELLAQHVHASVASTQPQFRGGELSGVDTYMERKIRGAQLVQPGSVQILSTFGDERNALVTVTMKIRLGPEETLVTMARAGLYAIDEDGKIKDERDVFFVL